jgi:hypothetical protein
VVGTLAHRETAPGHLDGEARDYAVNALLALEPAWRAPWNREPLPRGEHWMVGALPEPSDDLHVEPLPRRTRHAYGARFCSNLSSTGSTASQP